MPLRLVFLLLLLANLPLTAQKIALTELYFGKDCDFIELYNAGSQDLDLSDWQFCKGIRHRFAQGSILKAGAYLVLQQGRACNAQGLPYEGRLKIDGERLELCDAEGKKKFRWHYARGGSYPFLRRKMGLSMQLRQHNLPFNFGGAWIAAPPSPGQGYQASKPDAWPAIWGHFEHSPQQPSSSDSVALHLAVFHPLGIDSVWAEVQRVAPGAYVPVGSAAYAQNWETLAMQKQSTNDSTYRAFLPKNWVQHRHLLRYRFVAKLRNGARFELPRKEDPHRNFALFVYDGPAPYQCQDFKALPPLPELLFIAQDPAVQHAFTRYRGSDYPATGTVVHGGKVYEPVAFRSRGYNNRHSRRKRNLKFNFPRGQALHLQGKYGKTYSESRDKLVLSGGWLLENPNSHGLMEAVMYRLFNMQGSPAAYADFLHFRVLSQADESQDFWGLYLALENFDGDFLKTHDLPPGNIYSYKPFKLRHRFEEGVLDRSLAYLDWDQGHRQKMTESWWRSHLDLPAFYGFLATQQAINNRESGYRGQHWWMEYRREDSGFWYVFPWDMDLTWKGSSGFSTVASSISRAAFQHEALKVEYENYFRGFLDLLFNEDAMSQLIEEEARAVFDFETGKGFPYLDFLRWQQPYDGNFRAEMARMRGFVAARRAYLLARALPAPSLPKPSLLYQGPNGFPLDQIAVRARGIEPKAKYLEWRLAEQSLAKDSLYPLGLPWRYEAQAIWQKTTAAEVLDLQLEGHLLQRHRSYRVRVRQCDGQGRCSHWSEPFAFRPEWPLASFSRLPLLFSEVQYHPSAACGKLEFVELYNPNEEAVNLYGMRLEGGISYYFSASQELAAHEHLLLVGDSAAFSQRFKVAVQGEFEGKLDNKGEALVLRDARGLVMDSLFYRSKDGWDPRPDGLGFSLERQNWDLKAGAEAGSWRASDCECGSPGALNTTRQMGLFLPTWQGSWSWPWALLGLSFLGFMFWRRFKI